MKAMTKVLAFAAVATLSASAFAEKTYNVSNHAFVGNEGFSGPRGTNYSTGFESAEGFAPGYIGGQSGWTTFTSSTAEAHVDTANPFAGSQHMRISKDPALGSGSLTGGFSPDLGPLLPSQSYLSVMLNISNVDGADYDVVPQAPSQSLLSARVKFSFTGDLLVLDDTGGGLAFTDTGFDWGPLAGSYMRLEVLLDNGANSIDYKINGSTVYSSVAGVFAGTTFEQAVLLSDNFQLLGESGDFDNLDIVNGVIPAPGAFALLGIAGFAARRRRRA